MRIGIDARELARPDTGIGNYVIGLVRALAVLDHKNEYILFISSGDKACLDSMRLPVNFSLVTVPSYVVDKVQDQIGMVWAMCKLNLHVFHTTHHDVTPLLSPVAIVVTIHDIALMDFPSTSLLHRSYYRTLTSVSVRRALEIICISQSTLNRVLHYFPFTERKTSVVYYGRDESYCPVCDRCVFSKLAERLGIHKPFMLYVGSFTKRKNIDKLVIALPKIFKRRTDIQMVFVGSANGFNRDIFDNVRSKIIFVGQLRSKKELQALYSHADLLLFPSLYEGFGLPPLEAMACGCPVVTSNVSSLPEVVGNAGIQVDPWNPDAIGEAALKILKDDNLRAQMSQEGIARSQQFDWSKAARQTLEIYTRVWSQNRSYEKKRI